MIFVQLGIKIMDFAQAAMMAMILAMEHAASHSPTMTPLTKDVLHGTGKKISASNAQTIGYSTIKEFVYKFQTNAIPSIEVEHALVAIRATTLLMESASLHQFSKFLMLDAPHGTGISKFVFNAQIIGCLTVIRSVFQYLTNALPLIIKAFALLATKDII
jgi:hypothetical protein